MPGRARMRRGYVAAAAAGALVVLTPTAAFAGSGSPTDPLRGLVDQATQQLAPITSGLSDPTPGLPAPSVPAPSVPAPSLPAPKLPDGPAGPAASPSPSGPTPASDDDTAPNETTNPTGPDHGSAKALHADIAGQDVADAGGDKATVHKKGRSNADATVLAIGGQEILGAHASSTGQHESHAGNPLQPLCDSSGGQVCLQVLYADAYATDDGGRSQASSQSGLARICLGGSHTDPAAACDGPVHAGLLTGSSRIHRNRSTGRTTASSGSDVADACVSQPGSGGCALSADAVHSQGSADSGGKTPTAKRGSFLLDIQGGGQGGRIDQPTAIQLPPGCPPPSALCAYLNQGESYLGHPRLGGMAGTSQDALKAGALPGQPVQLDVLGGHSETLVHGQPATTGEPGGTVSGAAGGPGHPATGVVAGKSASLSPMAGLLPNTGGVWSGLLALALLAVAAGAFLVGFSRRGGRHRWSAASGRGA